MVGVSRKTDNNDNFDNNDYGYNKSNIRFKFNIIDYDDGSWNDITNRIFDSNSIGTINFIINYGSLNGS